LKACSRRSAGLASSCAATAPSTLTEYLFQLWFDLLLFQGMGM
jgi:hypothetical protein